MNNSGIYKILNIYNDKFYIGSSKDLNKRFREHAGKLRNNFHHSRFLQNSYNKYGAESFWFVILESCNEEELLKREQYYIDLLLPVYNVSKNASSPMKGRKHTEQTKKMFSEQRIGKSLKQPKHSIERRLSRSIARKNFKWSDEVKKKMSETAKRINSISRVDREKRKRKIIDSNNIIFSSMTEAAKHHRISIQTVCDILKGRHHQTRQKVSFKYV